MTHGCGAAPAGARCWSWSAGRGNATIAHELMISLKTVRKHVSNIFAELHVSDRSAAIVNCPKRGRVP